jgi:cytochrome c peroxidase
MIFSIVENAIPAFSVFRFPGFAGGSRTALRPALAAVALLLCACHGKAEPSAVTPVAAIPAKPAPAVVANAAAPKPLSAVAQLGRKLFFDVSLSASGQQSCASCHSPDHAFGPPNDLSVQMGGADLKLQGIRAVPNLGYKDETPNFSVGPDADDNDQRQDNTSAHPGRQKIAPAVVSQTPPDPKRLAARSAAQAQAKIVNATSPAVALVPQGGFFWDGRSDTLQGQALGPLLNPMEMGNASPEVLVGKLQQLSYADDFKQIFGPRILDDRRLLLSESLFAIARYEAEEKAFQPYSSKYDEYLRGHTPLSDAEMRGLRLFEDPKKGNCAACHPDKMRPDGRFPVFTDFQFEALGVPRNAEISANADAKFYDLSICGPVRSDDYSRQPSNCGLFKTPSLRNVATRHAFFHNGVFHDLDHVLHFYVERDIHPEKFYRKGAGGKVEKYDDLPPRYRANVDVTDAPFDRKAGDVPALDDAEIGDVIAFLGTLSDGYHTP